MATPPFDISTITPGDSDIVSQFPLNERGTRDIIESWITANHDTNGDHKWMKMPWQVSTPTTPAASIITVYADATGRLKIVLPDGMVHYVGIPPGIVIFTGKSSVPNGYLAADGSAVSRTTFSDLFTEIGILFGAGNGSTTFNVPDIKGRVIAGEDAGMNRLTAFGFGTSAVLAAGGGIELQQLVIGNIPHITSINGSQGINVTSSRFLVGTAGATVLQDFNPAAAAGFRAPNNTASITQETSSGSNSISVVSTGTVSAGPTHPNVQPTIILKALIKY